MYEIIEEGALHMGGVLFLFILYLQICEYCLITALMLLAIIQIDKHTFFYILSKSKIKSDHSEKSMLASINMIQAGFPE